MLHFADAVFSPSQNKNALHESAQFVCVCNINNINILLLNFNIFDSDKAFYFFDRSKLASSAARTALVGVSLWPLGQPKLVVATFAPNSESLAKHLRILPDPHNAGVQGKMESTLSFPRCQASPL